MALTLHFLKASDGTPLTKTFEQLPSGDVKKTPYPHVFRFDSLPVTVDNLSGMLKALRAHSAKGHCLLKGNLLRELDNESRAGTTDPNAETSWLCLDFDGLEGVTSAAEALALLELPPVHYIVQYSASMGIGDTPRFNAHIFIALEAPCSPTLLKTWLRQKNLTIEALSAQLRLTRSHNALRWPLDISVNQNDKLIYIAPPALRGGLTDPLKELRIALFQPKGASATLPVSVFRLQDPTLIDKLQVARLNQLRLDIGLPAKKALRTKSHKGIVVGAAPSIATVTSVKEDRGFVYVNLNGGDSWGYYFPAANPEVLYNFKGEENYALKDLAPELYAEYAAKAGLVKAEYMERQLLEQQTGIAHLAFLDPRTDLYYRGYYDYDTGRHTLHRTNSLIKVQHYMKQHGQDVGDFIPEWTYAFDYSSDVTFDPEQRFINRYQRSPCLLNATPGDWQTIHDLILHVMGGSTETADYFLNWLAFIIQKREPARTAWLLHGTQGTGKGVLFNFVLKPLVGETYAQTKQLTQIEEDYNAYAEECLFLMIDEAQISDLRSRGRVMSKLLNWIVEPYIPIRAMRTDHYMAPNFLNIIITSNKPDPIEIDAADRRMNVAPRQELKIQMTRERLARIEAELPHFADYLLRCKVNEHNARTPMESQAKAHIQYLTRSSIDLFADALARGDFEFFMAGLPTSPHLLNPAIDIVEANRHTTYATILHNIVQQAERDKHHHVAIPRDDLRFMAEYLLGKGVPDTPNKFTSYAKHHNIHVRPIKIGGSTVQGITSTFALSEEQHALWYQEWLPKLLPQLADKTLKAVKK